MTKRLILFVALLFAAAPIFAGPDPLPPAFRGVKLMDPLPQNTRVVATVEYEVATGTFHAVVNNVDTVLTAGGVAGTVTHTAGALTLNSVLLGNGAGDAKVDTGCSTDGAGALDCGSVAAGTKPTVGGSATGLFACVEGSVAMTPTAGQSGMRCDGVTHAWTCTVSGAAEAGCNPSLPSTTVDSDITCFTGTLGKVLKDCGVSAATFNTYPKTVVSGVSGGIPAFCSATQECASTLLTANGIVIGGGAGVAPSTAPDFTIPSHTLTGGASGIVDFRSMGQNALLVPVTASRNATQASVALNTNLNCLESNVGGTDFCLAAAGVNGNASTACTMQFFNNLGGSFTPTCSSLASDANTSQKTESAADTNVLTVTPAAVVASYRIGFVLSVSAAASAVVGWTATWTDSNGAAQTPTNLALFKSGTAAPALTFTTSSADNYYGEARIDVNNSATNIVIKFTLASGTVTAKASATVERVI